MQMKKKKIKTNNHIPIIFSYYLLKVIKTILFLNDI